MRIKMTEINKPNFSPFFVLTEHYFHTRAFLKNVNKSVLNKVDDLYRVDAQRRLSGVQKYASQTSMSWKFWYYQLANDWSRYISKSGMLDNTLYDCGVLLKEPDDLNIYPRLTVWFILVSQTDTFHVEIPLFDGKLPLGECLKNYHSALEAFESKIDV